MFIVLDNNKPADYRFHAVSDYWKNSICETSDQAIRYADEWLGPNSPGMKNLVVGEPYGYSGHGDFLVILEIPQYKEPDVAWG